MLLLLTAACSGGTGSASGAAAAEPDRREACNSVWRAQDAFGVAGREVLNGTGDVAEFLEFRKHLEAARSSAASVGDDALEGAIAKALGNLNELDRDGFSRALWDVQDAADLCAAAGEEAPGTSAGLQNNSTTVVAPTTTLPVAPDVELLCAGGSWTSSHTPRVHLRWNLLAGDLPIVRWTVDWHDGRPPDIATSVNDAVFVRELSVTGSQLIEIVVEDSAGQIGTAVCPFTWTLEPVVSRATLSDALINASREWLQREPSPTEQESFLAYARGFETAPVDVGDGRGPIGIEQFDAYAEARCFVRGTCSGFSVVRG